MNRRFIEIAAILVLDNGKRIKDAAKMSRYAKTLATGDTMPSIWVVTGAPGEKRLVLIDGWHRLQAHKRLGRTRIDAVLIDWTDYLDATRRVAVTQWLHGGGVLGLVWRCRALRLWENEENRQLARRRSARALP